jgi:hypothetical protein
MLLTLVPVLAAVLVWVAMEAASPVDRAVPSSIIAADNGESAVPAVQAVSSPRQVYPYSVVSGGVHSTEEFASVRNVDPVVARHYDDVVPGTLRAERVDAPRLAYMSYRVGDQIYWTKRRVILHEGEQILTDGETTIRGRCGNRLSETPMVPTSGQEPLADVFDRPVDATEHTPDGTRPGVVGGPGAGGRLSAMSSSHPTLLTGDPTGSDVIPEETGAPFPRPPFSGTTLAPWIWPLPAGDDATGHIQDVPVPDRDDHDPDLNDYDEEPVAITPEPIDSPPADGGRGSSPPNPSDGPAGPSVTPGGPHDEPGGPFGKPDDHSESDYSWPSVPPSPLGQLDTPEYDVQPAAPIPVPEPASWTLLASGGAWLLFKGMRARRQKR